MTEFCSMTPDQFHALTWLVVAVGFALALAGSVGVAGIAVWRRVEVSGE